jgi:hypothetical protein
MPTHEYKNVRLAQAKAQLMKKQYGYAPAVFEVKGHGRHFFAVSEPEGLVRVDRPQKRYRKRDDPFGLFG